MVIFYSYVSLPEGYPILVLVVVVVDDGGGYHETPPRSVGTSAIQLQGGTMLTQKF